MTGQITAAGVEGEVILVCDGSTDGTADLARSFAEPVHVIELPCNMGKAHALTAGCKVAVHDIIVFADMRQTWAADALKLLLENFADPAVGAVSGDLVVESAPGVMAGVGLYWRFEKWLRRQESRLNSTVGVTGAVCAVRRELFRPIPQGTILDDVYWPLQVIMQGFRVVQDGRTRAFDRLPDNARDEFRRKVRTLSGNLQLLTRLPGVLLPWRNPIWLQYVSHKLFRLLAPWALLANLFLSALLSGTVYQVAFWIQLAFYLIAALGTWQPAGSRFRMAGAAASFLVLNTAAWLAFWVWITGRSGQSWSKVTYDVSPPPHPALSSTGVRSQRSEVRSQRSEVSRETKRLLTSDL